MRLLKVFLAAGAAVVIGAVAAVAVWAWPSLYVPPVRDFELAEVEVVERGELRPCAEDTLTCLAALPYPRMVRVRLVSDQNLVEKAVAHELDIMSEAWSCTGRPERYAAGEFIAPGPYVNGERLPYGSRRDADRFYALAGTARGGRLLYDIYIVPRRDTPGNAHEAGKAVAPPYDLGAGGDVCVRIGGGNMLGGHFVGNTVRISSARIRAALAAG